ncbi:hypothetical protein RUM43_001737 [Polyplax serrata]|uniref:Metallo-beta-lactamase domain-containing protein 1 n=1 Tax=Polyplax serrata TaxID=468196 RepID=A0AAN8XR94_POLSC
MSNYEVFVLHEGYSKITESGMIANCTCTLIKGTKNIIVDTMTPWDREFILEKILSHGLKPEDVNFVVSTHGHSDHCGNNNLFLDAVHIVGYSISYKNFYEDFSFETQGDYKIDEYVRIIPTPGHTLAHVSVAVVTSKNETIVVAGDLFENKDDLNDETIWKNAGSENETEQEKSRKKILKIADYIIPGHGEMFKVPIENV